MNKCGICGNETNQALWLVKNLQRITNLYICKDCYKRLSGYIETMKALSDLEMNQNEKGV
jgi:hypothetical protein